MKKGQSDSSGAPCRLKALGERIDAIEKYLGLAGSRAAGRSVKSRKCGSSMNKGELLHLFYILMDEGILFLDPADERRNRHMLQDFIQEHFTYFGEGGRQHGIIGVSRHFSECAGFSYREKQHRHLDKIIELLQSRKTRLESR